MDRALIFDHLKQSIRHADAAEQRVWDQLATVTKLQRGGHNTASEEDVLFNLQDMERLHKASRDRLLKELEEDLRAAR